MIDKIQIVLNGTNLIKNWSQFRKNEIKYFNLDDEKEDKDSKIHDLENQFLLANLEWGYVESGVSGGTFNLEGELRIKNSLKRKENDDGFFGDFTLRLKFDDREKKELAELLLKDKNCREFIKNQLGFHA